MNPWLRVAAQQACLILATATLALLSPLSVAQPSLHETEPNDTPAQATAFAGAAILIGSMQAGDQDGYRWTVSDVDARKRWTFELQGIPGKLTIVEVLRVEYADNGVDVVDTHQLFVMGTRDGYTPSIHQDLVFEPGEYILGVAHSGGGGGFRPPAASISFGGESGAESAAQPAAEMDAEGYRLTIREGGGLPLQEHPADRASRASAHPLQLGFENAAYLGTPATWYRINISEADATKVWDATGQIAIGRTVSAVLRDADGTELARTASDNKGKFAFRDLGLATGSYYVELTSPDAGYIRTLHFTEVGRRIEGAEAEPNDSWLLANRANLDQPVTGRMGTGHEADYFTFSLAEPTTDNVLALNLQTAPDTQLQLCLTDHKGVQLQCRTAAGSVELADLVLTPGDWGFSVARGPQDAEYSVTLTQQGPITPAMEAEPNDRIEFAAAVPANNRIKGRFTGEDSDFFKFIVTDEPQLWRFQVIGDELFELAYHDGAGIQNQVYRAPAGQRRIRLENVFLMPGTHHVRVSGHAGGSYTLLARKLGPPDPNGEFEPNDDTSRMQPLQIGQARTGLLADAVDKDTYRFYLAAWDRIRLTLKPPADGAIFAGLDWGGSTFKQFNAPQLGQPVVLEGVLPPGDYRLALTAKTTSDADYTVSLERLERFGCPVDCEPNDNFDFANPLPANGILEGVTNEWGDLDWYALPVFDIPTDIALTSEALQQVKVVTVRYGATSLVAWDHETGQWQGTIPADTPTYIQVTQNGPYRFEIELSDALSAPAEPALSATAEPALSATAEPALSATAEPAPPNFAVDLTLDTTVVAAYRQNGQRVAGKLHLRNPSTAPMTLALQTAVSDLRWSVELDQASVAVPAGVSVTVPLIVQAPADVWADWPVRISAEATDAAGGRQQAFVEISAGRETTPVNPVRAWTLPLPLLGGFNVAWHALGGRWTGTEGTEVGTGFEYLFDGMAVEQQGLGLRGGTEPHSVDITVELAGDEPVEVVGLALNGLAGDYAQRMLRNLDVSLSLDGQQFTSVLTSELHPVKSEQAFVLRQPMLARYARLQPRHAFDGASGPALDLGEFKVIAKPGTDISAGLGFNLADPDLGGHVVWSLPAISPSGYWDDAMLREDGKYDQTRTKRGETLAWTIGFHHDRAAQINRLEWVDAPDTAAQQKIEQVAVAVSLESPVGPWLPVGEWQLSTDGSTSVLNLPEPTWARFVKFSVAGPERQKSHALPDALRIWERPMAGEYRSILSEWGFASQAAIYEHLQPLRIEQPFKAATHDSKANAFALAFEKRVAGQVVLGKHEHWYKLDVPASENTLAITVSGDPTVRTVAVLEDADGQQMPMRKIAHESTPHVHRFEALVEPAAAYYLRIEEPPRNVVFTWDTSASVGAYLPVIYNSMMAYAADVVPGLDAANLAPFGSDVLLRDWYGEPYILQTVLNDYPRKESSSEAEGTLYTAARALAPRAGTKAIVVMTDAATNRDPRVWEAFNGVQPRVFGLGVGSHGAMGRNPPQEQDLMQDWSRVNGGHYTYVLNEGEMEVAFDRVATLLRRPADYTLEVTSSNKEAAGPGSLTVISKPDAPPAAGAIELILDASGSMLKRLDGKRRIAIAKEVLSEAISEYIPSETPVALRVFGHKEPNACRTDLEIPLGPLAPKAALQTINAVEAKNLAKTPIADSLAAVASDLAGASGRKVVVLVTDGEETCEGDPTKAIEALQSQAIDVALNIVGFAIEDSELAAQFQSWAQLGGGRYFSADDQAGLSESIKAALQVPFSVYDQTGTLVQTGLLDGDPIALDQGYYRVVVQTSPPQSFSNVAVVGQQALTLEAGTSGN